MIKWSKKSQKNPILGVKRGYTCLFTLKYSFFPSPKLSSHKFPITITRRARRPMGSEMKYYMYYKRFTNGEIIYIQVGLPQHEGVRESIWESDLYELIRDFFRGDFNPYSRILTQKWVIFDPPPPPKCIISTPKIGKSWPENAKNPPKNSIFFFSPD